jgi:glycosyltransferase involved in cell wall biosynthesis
MSLYLDLTEFLTNPITTGIQRIAGEICRYAPRNVMVPVRLNRDRFVAFSPSLIDVIGNYFREGSQSGMAEIRRLGAIASGSPIEISQRDTVLVPEVFGNHERFAFFRDMPDQDLHCYRFIVFDLLPLTHPEYFGPDGRCHFCAYAQVIRRARNCSFISEYTRDMYYSRLRRTTARGGIVLPLGCDALGERPSQFTLNRPLNFSVLGTIEPRKNHHLILEAFKPLLRQVEGLTLTFLGKIGWVEREFALKVLALGSDKNSGLRFIPAPGDDEIRNCIEQSRATIYVSSAEGYGLPPVESLWAGTPVIASRTIPSLERLGSAGVYYVDPLSVLNLRKAVLAFLDDGYASRKTEEAIGLNLPTWRSFTQEVIDWCMRRPQGSADRLVRSATVL